MTYNTEIDLNDGSMLLRFDYETLVLLNESFNPNMQNEIISHLKNFKEIADKVHKNVEKDGPN